MADESVVIERLIERVDLSAEERRLVTAQTAALVERLRQEGRPSFLQSFLGEYGLSTEEGVALMSMAEAFLRVPDAATVDELIAEKISGANWQSHSGQAASFLVNASTWGLLLSGRLLTDVQHAGLIPAMRALLKRLGEPVVRVAMGEAMMQLGKHFVVGEDIQSAIDRTRKDSRYQDYSFSFDMLGEAAITTDDALDYFANYRRAMTSLASCAGDDVRRNSGISVKLSALHPRFELLHKPHCFPTLVSRMSELVTMAAAAQINLNIDGEDASTLELTLDVFEALARLPGQADWEGLGLVVQAYSRNAEQIVAWLQALAEDTGRRFMIRLVKGAYWDAEIKQAQVLGLSSYPVFTRKVYTDVSYLAAASRLLQASDRLYPMFATHNAHSVTAVLAMAAKQGVDPSHFELQRLYGMGEDLHEYTRREHATRHRIYAPVGEHEDLLAYLVRRLLENGANSSFVHQLTDASVPSGDIAADPIAAVKSSDGLLTPPVDSPTALFPDRDNSPGVDLSRVHDLRALDSAREPWRERQWRATPLLVHKTRSGETRPVHNPARPADRVGEVEYCHESDLPRAIAAAKDFAAEWSATSSSKRAEILLSAAGLLQEDLGQLAALLSREAGKTLNDVIGEWREAIDFLRYYASQCDRDPRLVGRRARGVVVSIAPWNFPLSIFVGQIAAALATGNVVLAKPAEQASLVAWRAVCLLHEAGVPRAALQLLPGVGESIGAALVRNPAVQAVSFTGSSEVARLIQRNMAELLPVNARLIAETGGINAMLVDSTALPEQTVLDILTSAFLSTGQRCSALRILYLQEEIAERFMRMLKGAMDTLVVGDPWRSDTDLGPVIDRQAQEHLNAYIDTHECLHRLSVPDDGCYVSAALIEVDGIESITREVFGPVLHVARYRSQDLDVVIDNINKAGYGLTAAIHSRLTQRVDRVIERLRVGNIYVNRNQIGAVVESQPFGGQGLSGTGPKAGGPLYLSALTMPNEEAGAGEAEATATATVDVIDGADIDQILCDLDNSAWLQRQDRLKAMEEIIQGATALAACDTATQRAMPGPTGERNLYQLRPLGPCLCLGPGPGQALNQALQALACGNPVLLCAPISEAERAVVAELERIGAPLKLHRGSLCPETLSSLHDLAAVSYCGSSGLARRILQSLAAREGPIVRFIIEEIDPAAYVNEVHVCNDITSAGGNVELMAATADKG